MLIQFSHHQNLTHRSKTIVSPCPTEGCHASMALGPISSKKHGSERGVTRRSLAGGKVGLAGWSVYSLMTHDAKQSGGAQLCEFALLPGQVENVTGTAFRHRHLQFKSCLRQRPSSSLQWPASIGKYEQPKRPHVARVIVSNAF